MPTLYARALTLRLGSRVLLDAVDLVVEEGGTTVLRGPSGSGKSSLLRCLAGLQPLEAGTLMLGDTSLDQLGPPAWRARVALVSQSAPVLAGAPPDTVDELRSFGAQADRPWLDAAALARDLGLDPATWSAPWTRLSGGERQRAHLVIALASQPEVLLLDEPTSALDPDATATVEALLRGRTCVWVSHLDAQSERIADHVLTLADGGLAA